MIELTCKFWSHIKKTEGGCWVWTGSKSPRGYGQWRGKDNKLYPAHRLAFEEKFGLIPDGLVCDHICHCRECVNPDHIRICNNTENVRNQTIHKNNTSGFKGVSFDASRRKWTAKIMVDRKTINLGRFNSPQEAHAVYCAAAEKYFGEFANSGSADVQLQGVA